ncbi:MAG TPA: hypothetical protein VGF61_11470 [Candidatus Acidoferrum sp.]|jgi:hypothetical protein
MSAENSHETGLKQKALHEAKEITFVFLYLAIFFCALATYSMLLLERFQISYFTYGAALLNAFIVTKIILIGEAVHLGKKHEGKPLIYSSIYKAFVFGLLVFGFHIVEEVVKRLIHGKDIAGAFREIRIDELLARSVIVFLTFIPFFAFRELGRVMGREKLRDLLFWRGPGGA